MATFEKLRQVKEMIVQPAVYWIMLVSKTSEDDSNTYCNCYCNFVFFKYNINMK